VKENSRILRKKYRSVKGLSKGRTQALSKIQKSRMEESIMREIQNSRGAFYKGRDTLQARMLDPRN